MKKEIKIKCPAKINLTLEILNKREDGFHNIQSVMQTISLFDILTIKIEESDNFEIKLSGTSDEIPYDERNLVYKAVMLFAKAIAPLTPNPSPARGEGNDPQQFCLKTPFQAKEECKRICSEGIKKLLLQRSKELRKESTTPEQILWYYLRDRRFIDLKFRRQVVIENYIADFVCFEKRLIIELDGSGHLDKKQKVHDEKRDKTLAHKNFKILRLYNNDIFDNLEFSLEKIYQEVTIHDQMTDQELLSDYGQSQATLLPHAGEGGETPDEGALKYKISVHIEKNIPIAAGLAGGSTDAAGVLFGLNKLFDNVLSNEKLHEICAKLGSDLNFCLDGGCKLATSRGEILQNLPFQEFDLSLIKPENLGISAKEAYTKLSKIKNKPNQDMTTKLVEALNSGDADIQSFLYNDLELAVIDDYTELQKIKNAYPKSIMSGSGSTFFVLDKVDTFEQNYWVKSGLKSVPFGVSVV